MRVLECSLPVALSISMVFLPDRVNAFGISPLVEMDCKSVVCTQLSLSASEATPPGGLDLEKSEAERENDQLYSLPWGELQAYALRDNLPKYVVSIPKKGNDAPDLYALWRTMTREITELSGYPVKMLVKVHQKQLKDQDSAQSKIQSTPKVLPLLDEYEFENSGGLSGRVYGIPGLAEGTKIETSAVVDVQVTLPRGFVQTQDDLVAYELGLPLRESYSLDGISRNKPQLSTTIIRDAAGEIVKTQVTGDDMLVRLGATTAILLAGATAVNMLSHHLTVNVFWV